MADLDINELYDSLDVEEIYENSVMYGEDLNKEGFIKYVNEKMAFIDSLFANPKINFIFPENMEIVDSAENVIDFIKDITRDSQKKLIKNTILKSAIDGYLDGLKNMGYIEIEDEEE